MLWWRLVALKSMMEQVCLQTMWSDLIPSPRPTHLHIPIPNSIFTDYFSPIVTTCSKSYFTTNRFIKKMELQPTRISPPPSPWSWTPTKAPSPTHHRSTPALSHSNPGHIQYILHFIFYILHFIFYIYYPPLLYPTPILGIFLAIGNFCKWQLIYMLYYPFIPKHTKVTGKTVPNPNPKA